MLTPEDEAKLDTFLERWEMHSASIKRLYLEFQLDYWDRGLTYPRMNPNEPTYRSKGRFTYVAPVRMLYEVEETRFKVPAENPEHANLPVEQRGTVLVDRVQPPEKFLYDGKVILEYHYKMNEDDKNKIVEYPIPPEMQGKGLSESPLPMIFGAKKDEMKNRYWMRVITDPAYEDKEVWLDIRPRWREDMSEFSRLEMRLHADLKPLALRKCHANGISREDYIFSKVTLNPSFLDPARIARLFDGTPPLGWTREVVDYTPVNAEALAGGTTPRTPPETPQPQGRPIPGTTQAPVGPNTASPYGPQQTQPQGVPQPTPPTINLYDYDPEAKGVQTPRR